MIFRKPNQPSHQHNAAALFDGQGNPTGTEAFLVIDNQGNVGIGTSPDNKLDVCGTIRSKEWIVEPDSWCDFVLHPDYEKMHWQKKKNLYLTEGRLPYMDSGAEIKKNGLHSRNLKGMMWNIEENRLDITELFERQEPLVKENKALKHKNKLLEKRLKALERRVEEIERR